MTNKITSFIYFTCFILALTTYHIITELEPTQEIASTKTYTEVDNTLGLVINK